MLTMFSFTSPIPGIRVVVQVPILLPLLRSGFLRGGMAGIRVPLRPCPGFLFPSLPIPKRAREMISLRGLPSGNLLRSY
jgi:hypothetical protein